MTVPEVIEAEAEDVTGQEIDLRSSAPVNLFRTEDPNEVVKRATETADALAEVVRVKELTKEISGKSHVLVEGWTLLGTMLGVFPVCAWTRKLEDGWEARVEARTLAGAVVGAAEAQCTRSESLWKNRDEYALRSMAQTRATSKALRQPLGFVMTLAGFQATPAEEMPSDNPAKPPANPPSTEQWKQMAEILAELEKVSPAVDGQLSWNDEAAKYAKEKYGKKSAELSTDELTEVIDEFTHRWEEAKVPFG